MTQARGMGTSAFIAIGAIVLVLGGALYFNMKPESEKMMHEGGEMMQEGESMMHEGEAMMNEGEQMMKDSEAMEAASSFMDIEYEGTLLGGATHIPLLDFNQADYEKALSEGKLITLFFYANWCPTCRIEFPRMQEAFDALPTLSSVMVKDVVGFRVNYNDNETDSYEKELAREFGVAYQHTKVFVKNGERILKSPEGWADAERYVTEIINALK